MFGSCRGRHLGVSTHGVGDQMSLLGGAILAGGVGIFDANTLGLGKVRRQKAGMAGSASILWPAELAWRRDQCEPGGSTVGSGGEQ